MVRECSGVSARRASMDGLAFADEATGSPITLHTIQVTIVK